MKKNAILLSLLILFGSHAIAQTKKSKSGNSQKSKAAVPSLCKCLTTPGGNPSNDYPKGCRQVIQNRYGTSRPSMQQMKDDYYECKGM